MLPPPRVSSSLFWYCNVSSLSHAYILVCKLRILSLSLSLPINSQFDPVCCSHHYVAFSLLILLLVPPPACHEEETKHEGWRPVLMTNNVVCFILTPFTLAQILFLIALRSVILAALVWWHLIKLVVGYHVDLLSRIVAMAVSVVTLPIRMLTALQREAKLEKLLNEMQIHLDQLSWEKREAEERLQVAIKDRKIVETLYEEIEEEHEKALARIDLLDNQLQELKEENMRLREIEGKSAWSYGGAGDGRRTRSSAGDAACTAQDHGSPSSARRSTSALSPKHPWESGSSLKDATTSHAKHDDPFIASLQASPVGEALERQRRVALSRSLFSALLSVLVGMIIWEAKDPCVPLVIALFIVVGMSLSSVIDFFSTIKNKPASDAVALLSVNWFILGALTSPTLPSLARVFSPWVVEAAGRVFSWLGIST